MLENLETDIPKKDSEDEVIELKEQEVVKEESKSEVKEVAQELVKGYMTYEQWIASGRDPEEYKGKKAFEKDGELFSYISNSNKERKELKEAIDSLVSHQKKLAEIEYNKGVEDTKNKLRQAASIGDVKQVEVLTDQLVNMQPKQQQLNPQDKINQAISDFRSRNADWLDPNKDENLDLILYAKQIDALYAQDASMGGYKMNPDEHLAKVEAKVKSKFKERFVKEIKSSAPVLEGESLKSTNTKKFSLSDLPADLKRQAKLLEKTTKNFDLQQYISDLKRIGAI